MRYTNINGSINKKKKKKHLIMNNNYYTLLYLHKIEMNRIYQKFC